MHPAAGFLQSETFVAMRRSAVETLLSWRDARGHWTGRLSSSALSTATAITALRLVAADQHAARVRAGADWLAATQLADGSWGDTVASRGNLSTTVLCWSALAAIAEEPAAASAWAAAAGRAGAWIESRAGGLDAAAISDALAAIYGRDRTFSVPILTHVALCGRFGDPRQPASWRCVPQLPFELAALPRHWFRLVDMQVVSYALPALIAIGQVRHAVAPGSTLLRALRDSVRKKTLALLTAIQPSGGGYLEATPLTSFVTMSLAGMAHGDHVVARRAVAFLTASQRSDGAWPIDTNLATWGTTLSVNALAAGGRVAVYLGAGERDAVRRWLLDQQWRSVHPATGAAPGGWAWTDLTGGVPDADDTSGAVVALASLAAADARTPSDEERCAVSAGLRWLADLVNRDGGVPTFCRGWGRLPFDTSCPDITAHALRAVGLWQDLMPEVIPKVIHRRLVPGGRRYLARTQMADGSWRPLWFGNEHHAEQANPVYGTARVVLATGDMRGTDWLLEAAAPDGGFGGGPGLPPSVEETAVAIEALARVAVSATDRERRDRAVGAVEKGLAWLAEKTACGSQFSAAPIGLYFAKLWYDEAIYPIAFTVAACERAASILDVAERDGGQVARLGFEPRQREPKSLVLPLHHRAGFDPLGAW